MARSAFKTLPVSVFLLISSCVFAGQEAREYIENMAKASKSLDYKGHFTLERGQQSTSYKFVHLVEGEVEKQRLVFLDGKPFEVISDGHHLKCIHPGEQNLSQGADSHAQSLNTYLEPKKNLGSIWGFYSPSIEGEGRVAGREVIRVNLKPKDDHRYPMEFYIDKATGLMLKMVVLNAKSQPLERFHYVEIEYNNVSLADLEPEIKDFSTVMHEHPSREAKSTSLWHLAWLPEGFTREEMPMVPWSTKEAPVDSLMYTDGLSSFSVFIEQSAEMGDADSGTSSQIGSTSAVSQYVKDGSQFYRVTVVGEIPLMTAKQIALSLKKKP